MLYTTLMLLHEHEGCLAYSAQFARLVELCPLSYSISLVQIQQATDMEFALWSMRATTTPDEAERIARLLACDYAERVLPVWKRVRDEDPRLAQAIETARKLARGETTSDDLDSAKHAANSAWWDAKKSMKKFDDDSVVLIALENIADAVALCASSHPSEVVYLVAEAAFDAVKHIGVVLEDINPRYERAWQIKRFTDLLENREESKNEQ
jgi:hypothetical protein